MGAVGHLAGVHSRGGEDGVLQRAIVDDLGLNDDPSTASRFGYFVITRAPRRVPLQ